MTESFKAIIIGFLYSFKMEKSWFWTCILIIGLFPALLFANGPVHTHIFRDGDAKKLFFHDSLYVLVDNGTQLEISDMLKLSDLAFSAVSRQQ